MIERGDFMNNGFFIGNKNTFLDSYVQKSASLGLIGKGDGCEIMIQNVQANETIFIDPADNPETLEFFYIISGTIEYLLNDESTILCEGDTFYVQHLTETIQLTTTSDVQLLYLSTAPVFQYLSKTISDLTKLAEEVEKKDSYTHSHIQRVKEYSLKMAMKLHLSKDITENIVYASLFHDIGKMNIPDDVLNKPSSLSNIEFSIVKNHPKDGVDIVSGTFYKKIAAMIEQHHEKVDGTGYPAGLKGEEIHIGARIISVADSYDAMTTDRPYRKALTNEEAATELIRCKNTQFDALIVDTFIAILKQEGAIT